MEETPLEALWLLGLSHRTAPIAVRECFAFDDEAAFNLVTTLRQKLNVSEAIVLSTCNRTEVYFVCKEADLVEKVAAEVAGSKGRPLEDLARYLYRKNGIEVARHLFRVAASLDSLVVGEPQILGQVKNAYQVGKGAKGVGPILGRIFERAFKVAKQVRTETGVGEGRVSVGSVAVDLAKKVFGDLGQCTVLLIGAGKMAEAVARTLSLEGARKVVVANRTLERARLVASRFGWEASPLDDLKALLVASDVVITSVSFEGYLVDVKLVRPVMATRRYRPLFIVDISVPRVVEPKVGELEGCYLYNIDDFNIIIEGHLRRRKEMVRAAEEFIEREVLFLQGVIRQSRVEPLIGALHKMGASIREREVARALRELGPLGEREVKVIEAMANSIVTKLLHNPVTVLRRAALEGRDLEMAELVIELFGLDSEGAEKKDGNTKEEGGG